MLKNCAPCLTIPTLCRLCRRWQSKVFCDVCLQHSAASKPRCVRCAIALPDEPDPIGSPNLLCRLCDHHPPMFDHGLAAFDYCAPWDKLISQLKFHQDTALAKPLAQLLLPKIWARWQLPSRPHGPSLRRLRAGAPSLILPVPLSPQRLRERGYNQAALLAKHLGWETHVPVNQHLLVKRLHTERLMSMQSHERQSHIRGVFTLAPGAGQLLRQRHVAVVDDVLTTGATLNEIARLLWRAGAREVSAWVVARTPF